MSSALMIECPVCHAAPGNHCWDTSTGYPMARGHEARTIIGLWPEGELGPKEDDDPDEHITPLGDIPPPVDPRDHFADRTVLRWTQVFGSTHYTYVAIKAEGVGWFLSGKTTEGLTWDTLWNKHLRKATWIEEAAQWQPLRATPESTP